MVDVPFDTVTITTLLSGVGTIFGAGILGLLLRQLGPWRKQTTDASDKLIAQLTEQLREAVKRIERVERGREADRRLHYIQERKSEARHNAQRSLDRHKFRNSEGSFDALLLLFEQVDNLPERIIKAIAKVREKRIADRESENQEAAIIHAAEIKAIAIAERELDELERQERAEERLAEREVEL
jgi:hypothetical protein